MATNFRNKVLKEVGTTETNIITASELSRITVIGLSVANLTEGTVIVSVTVTDDLGTKGHYVRNAPLAPHQSMRLVNGGEKLVLPPNNSLDISTNFPNSVDVVASYVEII
jgi:hypothetical protein